MQKDIILVPFNMDAIYALHVLENERDVVVSGFPGFRNIGTKEKQRAGAGSFARYRAFETVDGICCLQ